MTENQHAEPESVVVVSLIGLPKLNAGTLILHVCKSYKVQIVSVRDFEQLYLLQILTTRYAGRLHNDGFFHANLLQ